MPYAGIKVVDEVFPQGQPAGFELPTEARTLWLALSWGKHRRINVYGKTLYLCETERLIYSSLGYECSELCLAHT